MLFELLAAFLLVAHGQAGPVKFNIPRNAYNRPSYALPRNVGTPTDSHPSSSATYALTVPVISTPTALLPPTSFDSSVGGGRGFPSSTWSITPPIILPPPGTTSDFPSTPCSGAQWTCTTPPILGMCWGGKEWIPCDYISTYRSTSTITISSTITKHFPPSSQAGSWSIDSSVSGGTGTPAYTSAYTAPISSSTPWTISSRVSAGSSCPIVSLTTLTVTPYSCIATPTSTIYVSATSTFVTEVTSTRVVLESSGTPPPPNTVTLNTTRYYGPPAPPSIITVTNVRTGFQAAPSTVTWKTTEFDTTTRTIRVPYPLLSTTTTTTAALWPAPSLCTPCIESGRETTIYATETVYTSTTTTLPTPGSTVSSIEGLTSTLPPVHTSEVGPPISTWPSTLPSYGPPTYAAPPGPVFSAVRDEE